MSSRDVTDFVESALDQFEKTGPRFDSVRQKFPSTAKWLPCTGQKIGAWRKALEWKQGTVASYDLEAQTMVVVYEDDRMFTHICQQLARLFIWHFTGVRDLSAEQWQPIGNIIGFNSDGMVSTPVAAPPPFVPASGSAVPPWLRGTQAPAHDPRPTPTPTPTPRPVASEPSKVGGAVKRVWEICDANPGLARGVIIALCEKAGINKNTAGTQYAKWKKARQG